MQQTNIDYVKQKAYIDSLFKNNLISFIEWYTSLIKLRQNHGLVTAT